MTLGQALAAQIRADRVVQELLAPGGARSSLGRCCAIYATPPQKARSVPDIIS
jgi:hypothetical protein